MNDKVSVEVAESEFEQWAASWGINTDLESMDEDSAQGFRDHKSKIVRAVIDGRATVDTTDFKIEYMARGGDVFEFREPTGAALLAMDGTKEKQHMAKLFHFLGHITGKNPRVLANLSGPDLKFAQAVASLFLAG